MRGKNLLSDRQRKTAIIQYFDGRKEKIESCQGHWTSQDVIHLCLEPNEWIMVDKVLFLYVNP